MDFFSSAESSRDNSSAADLFDRWTCRSMIKENSADYLPP